MTNKLPMTKWSSVIRGCAYGDAWGDPNEFKGIASLTKHDRRGPDMPLDLRITDDTQMSLALAKALNGTPDLTGNMLRARVLDAWLEWYHDPDNNRAPGNRTMAACRVLDQDRPWMDSTDERNDGCGTVMRTSACAFLPIDLVAPVAIWQAVTTHGGPNGAAAALTSTLTIRAAAMGKVQPGTATSYALSVVDALLRHSTDVMPSLKTAGKWIAWHTPICSDDWADQWAWIEQGLQGQRAELVSALSAGAEWHADPWAEDPCKFGGEGWRAHECLATALLSADSFVGNPTEALRRAVTTNGDSDSIGAVAGAILGAVYDDPWPVAWFQRIEPRYRTWINESEGYVFA